MSRVKKELSNPSHIYVDPSCHTKRGVEGKRNAIVPQTAGDVPLQIVASTPHLYCGLICSLQTQRRLLLHGIR